MRTRSVGVRTRQDKASAEREGVRGKERERERERESEKYTNSSARSFWTLAAELKGDEYTKELSALLSDHIEVMQTLGNVYKGDFTTAKLGFSIVLARLTAPGFSSIGIRIESRPRFEKDVVS